MPGCRIIKGGGEQSEIRVVAYNDLEKSLVRVADLMMRQVEDDAADGFAHRVGGRQVEALVIVDTTIFVYDIKVIAGHGGLQNRPIPQSNGSFHAWRNLFPSPALWRNLKGMRHAERLLTVYSAKQFQDKYQLDKAEARRIIIAVGEARADLDAFMTVYSNRRQAEHWLMDTAMPAAR